MEYELIKSGETRILGDDGMALITAHGNDAAQAVASYLRQDGDDKTGIITATTSDYREDLDPPEGGPPLDARWRDTPPMWIKNLYKWYEREAFHDAKDFTLLFYWIIYHNEGDWARVSRYNGTDTFGPLVMTAKPLIRAGDAPWVDPDGVPFDKAFYGD